MGRIFSVNIVLMSRSKVNDAVIGIRNWVWWFCSRMSGMRLVVVVRVVSRMGRKWFIFVSCTVWSRGIF